MRNAVLPHLLVFAVLGAVPAAAQTPDTDIWVAELHATCDSLHIGTPRNVTQRPGYDNQPWFLPDGRSILYVAERDEQTDVFRLDLGTGAVTQITRTPEREYSPTLTPDGRTLLAVRWAADMSDGHLWRYSPTGEPLGAATGDVSRIGYYAFGDSTTMAIFVNDSVQSFVLADARTGRTEKIGERLGGSPPKAIPGEPAVSFLRMAADSTWWITRLDLTTRETRPLIPVLKGKSQYSWTPDGRILMASGSEIFVWDPREGGNWTAVARFDAAVGDVSRIAVSPDSKWIAFVAGS